MLHFLIGTAILVWIVVTLTHFIGEQRERRLIAKHLAPPAAEPSGRVNWWGTPI